MKINLSITVLLSIVSLHSFSQVTKINSNNSLKVILPLNATKTLLRAHFDSTLWVTDGTVAGTKKLSTSIFYGETGGLLNGKLIFSGRSAANGYELFITDGTEAGTSLLKDINPGTASSEPGIDFALMGGYIYFTAQRPAEGRELWRTNGTEAGTTLVKDIRSGTDGSNSADGYHLFSTGNYLLFAAATPTTGLELWMSTGTDAGTAILKDINTGHANADSSSPNFFHQLGSTVLFTAIDATHGEEIWKTDGTVNGTTILKDINNGPASSTSIEFFPGLPGLPVFLGFHNFNNRAYFQAYDGTSGGEVWSTDGSSANTSLLKDIVSGGQDFSIAFIPLDNAVNLSDKFMFGVYDGADRSELWQSDGTPDGTTLFKAFSTQSSGPPVVFHKYVLDVNIGTISNPLFQTNKFFFGATTDLEGDELWISDGTLPNTKIVKDIDPAGSGLEGPSWAFNSTHLYFTANNGTTGIELWKSDGTLAGTSPVADIYTGPESSDPELFPVGNSDNLIFSADDGDNPIETDLFVLGGGALPPADPCPGANITLTSNVSGSSYQWQVNTGGGFSNVSNNATYSGATTSSLLITAPPSSFYGYQYRCDVTGVFSSVTTIRFVSYWTGASGNLWNNAANWSCNAVPDGNTDVVIDKGTPVLNVNGTCRSIKVMSGANFHANPGVNLAVTH